MVRQACSLAGGIPGVRQKVLANMRLALGSGVSEAAARRYFEQTGWLLSRSLATFHNGLGRTPVMNEVTLGPTASTLDEALAEGRGVVLTTAHWVGHELALGIVSRHHPTAFVVRRAGHAERAAVKAKWYRSLGAETVLRPDGASTLRDAAAYLKILKQGKILAISPDLLAGPDRGVEVILFGRQARVFGGAFAFAFATGAPIVRMSLSWQSRESIVANFDRAPSPAGVREAAIQSAAQDWCCWFEARLRSHPENWLFWLDRRWSGFLRAVPSVSAAP
jgi:lauroyl/myristoyl acyltransferase